MGKTFNISQLISIFQDLTGKADQRFEKKIFKGTTEEWTALSSSEKAKYDVKIITNDTQQTNVVMEGATAQANGKQGLVPQPLIADRDKFLKGDGTWGDESAAIAKCETLVLSANSISALPYTFTNSAIETDMVCINSELSNPSVQLSDWTVNTDTAGQATISGTISGSTNIKIYLMKSR